MNIKQNIFRLGSIYKKLLRPINAINHLPPPRGGWGGGGGVGGGEMVYGIDWPQQLLINRPQPKNVLFDVHNYPLLLLRHLF
jgi:hypothetical protein